MSFTPITVTGTYHKADSSAEVGTVTFQLMTALINGSDERSTDPIVATLDASGHISVVLAATDDPGTEPTGVTYLVLEELSDREVPWSNQGVLAGYASRAYYLSLPHTLPGGTVDLSTIVPVAPGSAVWTAPSASSMAAAMAMVLGG